MSVYFLRHQSLIKIGFSSDLGTRIRAIIGQVPGGATFVGHMPGDRSVEGHFHEVFAASRFSGEWFQSTPELEAFMASCLKSDLPDSAVSFAPFSERRADATNPWAVMSMRVRDRAAEEWPKHSHGQRLAALVELFGWRPRRMRALYHIDPGCVLRHPEAEQLERWLRYAKELTADAADMSPVDLSASAPGSTDDLDV